MQTTPQKRLFQPRSEILVHRGGGGGGCILNGMAHETPASRVPGHIPGYNNWDLTQFRS